MRQPLGSVCPPAHPDADDPPRGRDRPSLTERVAGWSVKYRKTAVFGWLLLVAAVFVAGQAIGSKNLPSYDFGQSGQAERVLHQVAPAQYGAYSQAVLIQPAAPGATFATDPAMRAAASQLAASLRALPRYAAAVATPLSGGGRSLVSADGRSALVTFDVPGNVADVNQAATADQRAVAAVAARHPDLRIAESGDASIAQAVNDSLNFSKAEATSVPITLILLLIIFGSLVAAGIPVLLALTALTAAIGSLTLVGNWVPVGSSTFEVVVIIGMAVGVDYSLFYLRREREERARVRFARGVEGGSSPLEEQSREFHDALRVAARTSGRTILVSGLTVMAAMSGLFLTGGGPFPGMAIGTIAVVGIAVVGSLTVLPALLAWLGPRADAGRIPFLGRGRAPVSCWRKPAGARPSRLWAALVRRVVARPAIWGGVAAIALLALAVPALGLRLGAPAVDAPAGAPAVRTMAAIERAFPQAPAPAEVVVTGPDVTGPRVLAAVGALRERAAAPGGQIREPVTVTAVGGGRALVVGVTLAGNGADAASYHALADLRGQILPDTLGKVPGVSYAVTGDTAQIYDDVNRTHDIMPAVFALVAVLSFVLLMVAFRSVAIPLASIVLNLLSVGAAYGLVTLIFQDGRLQGLLGYTSFGGIIFWVPLMMFVFLFGISMDYHVFILSRIRELWSRDAAPRDAIIDGVASSAGVVTSAALIMVAVFSIFVTMPLVDLKILGVGVAAAVLIDATVVRGVLLPATLALLGDRAWGRARRKRR